MGGGPGKGIGEKRERRFDGLAMRSLRRCARRCDSYGYRGGVSTAVETSRNRRRDETRPAARDQQEGLNDTHGSRRARIAALGTMAERSFLSLSVSQSLCPLYLGPCTPQHCTFRGNSCPGIVPPLPRRPPRPRPTTGTIQSASSIAPHAHAAGSLRLSPSARCA